MRTVTEIQVLYLKSHKKYAIFLNRKYPKIVSLNKTQESIAKSLVLDARARGLPSLCYMAHPRPRPRLRLIADSGAHVGAFWGICRPKSPPDPKSKHIIHGKSKAGRLARSVHTPRTRTRAQRASNHTARGGAHEAF